MPHAPFHAPPSLKLQMHHNHDNAHSHHHPQPLRPLISRLKTFTNWLSTAHTIPQSPPPQPQLRYRPSTASLATSTSPTTTTTITAPSKSKTTHRQLHRRSSCPQCLSRQRLDPLIGPSPRSCLRPGNECTERRKERRKTRLMLGPAAGDYWNKHSRDGNAAGGGSVSMVNLSSASASALASASTTAIASRGGGGGGGDGSRSPFLSKEERDPRGLTPTLEVSALTNTREDDEGEKERNRDCARERERQRKEEAQKEWEMWEWGMEMDMGLELDVETVRNAEVRGWEGI